MFSSLRYFVKLNKKILHLDILKKPKRKKSYMLFFIFFKKKYPQQRSGKQKQKTLNHPSSLTKQGFLQKAGDGTSKQTDKHRNLHTQTSKRQV